MAMSLELDNRDAMRRSLSLAEDDLLRERDRALARHFGWKVVHEERRGGAEPREYWLDTRGFLRDVELWSPSRSLEHFRDVEEELARLRLETPYLHHLYELVHGHGAETPWRLTSDELWALMTAEPTLRVLAVLLMFEDLRGLPEEQP